MTRFPPGPPEPKGPIALARYFRDLTSDSIAFVGERFDRYGDIYYAPLRGNHLFATRHPDHFEQVLVKQARSFEKTTEGFAAKRIRQLLGDGLVNIDGDVWRRHRRLINPALSRQTLEQYASTFVGQTEAMLDDWLTGQTIDLGFALTGLTLRIVTKVLFDHDSGEIVDTVHDAMEAFKRSMGVGMIIPDALPWPSNKRFFSAIDVVDEIIQDMVEQRRALPVEELRERSDLMSALILATDEDGGLDDQELRDELMTLFFAGHETTSNALVWALYLLSQHPDVRDWVVEELPTDRELTYADFEQLPRTRAALEEAMRVFPPVCTLSRTAVEDVVIDGYDIPAGSEVLIWFYWAHHDQRWFPEPDRYDPPRFLDDPDWPRLAYMPFGGGQRTCVGKHFALLEGTLILATVLRRCTLEYEAASPPRTRMTVTLSPADPMRMRVQ